MSEQAETPKKPQDDQPGKTEQPGKSAPAKPKKPRGPRRWPLVLALVVVVAAAGGGGYYLWREQQALHTELHGQLTELQQTLRTLDKHSSLIEIKRRVAAQDARLESALAEQQNTIDALHRAFELTRQVVDRDQRGWILAEVEYLMRIAITRLRLTHDVNGAIQALETADERLADLADPAMLRIREILASEITALKGIRTPDVEGAALKTISIANRLHLLPRARRPAVPGEDAREPASRGDGFWGSELLHKLGLHRTDAPVTTARLQSELYYVEQLMRLELESARQAALRFDKESFDRHVAAARNLLDEHYRRDHEQVIRIRAELAALRESKFIPRLPDISGSLQKLREVQQSYRPAPVEPPQTEPESEPETGQTS